MTASLTNERSVNARTNSREDYVDYVSPNSLLLSQTIPKGDLRSFRMTPTRDWKSFKEKWTDSGRSGVNWLVPICL